MMGGEKFETVNPECFLFGENSDLNYLCNKPAPVSLILTLKYFSTYLFPSIDCVCIVISTALLTFFNGFPNDLDVGLLGMGPQLLFTIQSVPPSRLLGFVSINVGWNCLQYPYIPIYRWTCHLFGSLGASIPSEQKSCFENSNWF